MKDLKILITVSLLLGITVFSSCKQFLEEDIRSSIPQEDYFNNEEEAIQFLYGCYANVRSCVFGESFYMITDGMTDDMQYRGGSNYTARNVTYLLIDSRLNAFQTVWSNLYELINNCNILIDKVPDIRELVSVWKSGEQLEAEARVMRAWAFLNLVQLWGDVPLMTLPTYKLKDDNLYPRRSPALSVYSQIMNDLDYAFDILPSYEGRVITLKTNIQYPLTLTQSVVRTLRARVNLINKQYEDAIADLQPMVDNSADGDIVVGEITGSTPYGLMSNVRDVFAKELHPDKWPSRRREILWTMEANNTYGIYNSWHRITAPTNSTRYNGTPYESSELPCPTTGASAAYCPTEEFMAQWDGIRDLRYQWQYKFFTTSRYPLFFKGYDMTAADNSKAGNDVPLIRFAEVLLMHAEVANELRDFPKAIESLNRVRVRAGLDRLELADLTDVYGQLRDAIRMERRKEFAHEGFRLFDMRRYDPVNGEDYYYWAMKEFVRTMDYMMDESNSHGASFTFRLPQQPNIDFSVHVPWGLGNKYPEPNHKLHPIPYEERIANKHLTQNEGYN